MNSIDVVLLVVAGLFAISGFRRGFLVGSFSFAGFLAGGVLGMVLAPGVVDSMAPGTRQALVAVIVVLVAAVVGQALLGMVAMSLRRRLLWRPARLLDSTLGAALGVTVVLVAAWFLASAVRDAPSPTLTRAVRDSRTLTTVDKWMPDAARGQFLSFRRLLDEGGLPRAFSGLARERIRAVQPPDPSVRVTPGLTAAARSIVKVTGLASCDRGIEGSGFTYAPQHVVTNAHVVAGVDEPRVQVGGRGPRLRSVVVAFDSKRDLAVLHVPELQAPALRLDPSGSRGDQAVVAGFPRNGPYRLDSARIREQMDARGPDIYGRTQVRRQMFSLYATVQPGNSGGPLLSTNGQVYAVVFAKSVDDARTAYALTVPEVRRVSDAAADETTAVETGECAD